MQYASSVPAPACCSHAVGGARRTNSDRAHQFGARSARPWRRAQRRAIAAKHSVYCLSMSTTLWFILIGCLMLARGLAATTLARLPVTSAIVYLGVGLALGPAFFGVFAVDPYAEAGVLEVMTELAVLISLFSAGVKMPVPFSLARWAPSLRLAWLSMSISVGLMAAFGTLVLGLPLGAAVLLGAILAPTDPVLATDVQVRHAGDRDKLRFALTSEAGMNDGSAFPFVMLGLGLLGLHQLGDFGWRWLALDVLWGTMGAVMIGIARGESNAQGLQLHQGALS
eukprot:gene42494-52703_t